MSLQISDYYSNPFATPLYKSVSTFCKGDTDSRKIKLLKGMFLIADIFVGNPIDLSWGNIAILRKNFFKHSFGQKFVSLAICTLGCLWVCCMLPFAFFGDIFYPYVVLKFYHHLDPSQRAEYYLTLHSSVRFDLYHGLDTTHRAALYLSLENDGRSNLCNGILLFERAKLYLSLNSDARKGLLALLSSRGKEELKKEVDLLLRQRPLIKPYRSLPSLSLKETGKNPADITCTITLKTYLSSPQSKWIVVKSATTDNHYDFFVYDSFVRWCKTNQTNPNTREPVVWDNIKKLKP